MPKQFAFCDYESIWLDKIYVTKSKNAARKHKKAQSVCREWRQNKKEHSFAYRERDFLVSTKQKRSKELRLCGGIEIIWR